jgi:hypothetical protein
MNRNISNSSAYRIHPAAVALFMLPACATAAWVIISHEKPSGAPADPATAALARELAALRAELEETRGRLAALERSRPAVAEVAAAPKVAPLAPVEAPEPGPDRERKQEIERRVAEDFARADREAADTSFTFDARLEEEQVDPAWSAEEEARILGDTGAGKLGAAHVLGAECRSTLCRVELEHPDAKQLDRLFFDLISKPAFAGRRIYTHREGNNMTMYVARSGHALPRANI